MSTYLDYALQTKDQLKTYILENLGHPLITVEITDSQLEICINDAVEYFTKYCMQDQDFVAQNLSGYVENVGITLPGNITGIFALDDMSVSTYGDFNTLFSIPNSMLNSGMLSIPYSDTGLGWINWELFQQNLDMMKRMLGGGFQFEYNPRNKILKLFPDPTKENLQGSIVFGVNVIRPETMQYGEEWVKKYSLALSKIIVGRVRSKYSGVQLLGGGNLDTSILEEGKSERDQLMNDLRASEQGPYGFWMG